MKAIAMTEQMSSNFSKDQLLALCEKEVDASVHRVVKLLDAFFVSCYVSSSPFLPVVACIIIQFSLQHGICPEAPVAFAIYSMLKIFLAGDFGGARFWADRVLEMEAKHRSLNGSNESVETTAPLILVSYIGIDAVFINLYSCQTLHCLSVSCRGDLVGTTPCARSKGHDVPSKCTEIWPHACLYACFRHGKSIPAVGRRQFVANHTDLHG